MRSRTRRLLLALAGMLLLLPATLFVILLATLSYPAYPLPQMHPLQVLFDLGMLITVLGFVAAWRLLVGYLRHGRNALHRTTGLWMWLLAAGALLGMLGTGLAVEHIIRPRTAADFVGFMLFAPAVVLALLWAGFWSERRRASTGRGHA